MLKNKRIVIIGGSSGIGLATAIAASEEGAQIIIAGRSVEKLSKAKLKIKGDVITKKIDLIDYAALENFFEEIGSFDHLQLPGSDMRSDAFLTFPIEEAKVSFESKFWGPYVAAKYAQPYLNKHEGSITFYSGAYSHRPIYPGAAVAAAINGAIESLAKALAVELAPIRVNVVSPGLTMTERFTEKYSSQELKNLSENFSKQLIIKRPALPEEIAKTAIYLMNSSYTTGSTLFTDGGLTLI